LRRESSRKKRISPIDQEIIERVADICEPQGLENNLERLYHFIYQLDELNRVLMLLYLDAPPIRRSAKSSASARAMSPPRSAALNNRSNRPLKLNRINKSSHHMNMELQELKDLWRQHDEKLARQVKLNMHLLKKIELKNTRSALRKATLDPVFSLIFGFFMLIPLVPFIYNHIQQLQYAGPATGLALYALLLVIDSISRLSIIDAIDYDGSVIQIQQQVERLSIHNLRYTLPLNISWGALWLFVPIVCLKGLGYFDIYSLHQGWIMWDIAICSLLGIVFAGLAVWLSRHYNTDQITQPWLKKTMDQLAGRSLAKARASLKEIEDFARES
jgi:hypothetical protein